MLLVILHFQFMYDINMKLTINVFYFEKSNIEGYKEYKMQNERSGEKGIKDIFKPKRILIDCEEEESVASSSSQV